MNVSQLHPKTKDRLVKVRAVFSSMALSDATANAGRPMAIPSPATMDESSDNLIDPAATALSAMPKRSAW
jgi:hypothetical protein